MSMIPLKRGERELSAVFPEMNVLRSEVDDLFARFFGSTARKNHPAATQKEWFPSLDLKEGDKEITITCEVPGVDPKAVDVSLIGNTLTIKGEKKTERVEDKDNYHYAERSFGSFLRTVELPQEVDSDQIAAEQKDGVLTIRLKKLASATPKKIPVKA